LTILVCAGLLVLVGGAFSSAFWSPALDFFDTNPAANAAAAGGSQMIQLALDKNALTSILVQRLHVQPDLLSDMTITPMPNDGLVLTTNLHVNVSGIQRVMPVEVDSTVGVDSQQDLHLTVQHLKRDGLDAGPLAVSQMQTALNQMLVSAVMPALHRQFKSVKLISAHTSSSISCGRGIERLVLQVEAPPIKGVSAQSAPLPFCLDDIPNTHNLSSLQNKIQEHLS
jgi:hypothetical protein